MVQELVGMYENGEITADHLVVESLHKLDPAAPALVLAVLPRGVLERMLAYAENYRPGAMKTKCGLPPAPGRRRATMDRSEFHRGQRRPWHPAQAESRRAKLTRVAVKCLRRRLKWHDHQKRRARPSGFTAIRSKNC